jgi:amino acid permease
VRLCSLSLKHSKFPYYKYVYKYPTRCNGNILVLFQDLYLFQVPAVPIIRNTILQLAVTGITYRVIQEESAILWEIIVCVILSKKVHMNMGPILNGYQDYSKKKIRTILRAQTAIT